MNKIIKTYYLDFVSTESERNSKILQKIIDAIIPENVEAVEKLFDITFASGVEKGRPIFLNLDGEDNNDIHLLNKYDGKVLLTTPPLDHKIGKPFTKTKLTFKIETKETKEGFIAMKGYINSKFRNSLDY